MNRDEHAQLCQKHGIDERISDFGTLKIDKDADFVSEVVKTTIGFFEQHAASLEGILHPEQSLSSMHENSAFTEEEQMKLLELFRKFMQVLREGEYSQLAQTEKEFIAKALSVWSEVKPQLLEFSRKLADSWTSSADLQQEFDYLG